MCEKEFNARQTCSGSLWIYSVPEVADTTVYDGVVNAFSMVVSHLNIGQQDDMPQEF